MHTELTHIYTLSCPETGLVRYIGKSNNPNVRFSQHLRRSKKEKNYKKCWISSLLEKGSKPIMQVIDSVPFCDWQFWEKYYIKLFKSMGAKLTNQTDGGDGRKTEMTEVEKQLIRKRLSGTKRPKHNLIGKKVFQLDEKLSVINTFISIQEAATVTKIKKNPISAVCNKTGNKSSAGGFYWTFNPDTFVPSGPIRKNFKTIIVECKNKTFKKVFNSYKDVLEEFSVSASMLSRYCRGEFEHKKYNFNYAD